jgi:hypothetical protein
VRIAKKIAVIVVKNIVLTIPVAAAVVALVIVAPVVL